MKKFDKTVPDKLKQKQEWFASIITQPIDEESLIQAVTPSGGLIVDEAWDHIAPSPTLDPSERIQIYNQQFWWRILKTLHSEFPLLTRLFGFSDFNKKIGYPYIQKYMPEHWSLSLLGNRLLRWAEEEYKENDKKLVCDAISVDWAFNYSFIAAHYPSLGMGERANLGELEALIKETVFLQPHLFLFEMEYDIFQMREKFLQFDPDYWLENDFPKFKKDRFYYFVYYRNIHNIPVYEEVIETEYRMLQQFRCGSKIEDAINWLEGQDGSLQNDASENLHLWLQKWTLNQWLTPYSEKTIETPKIKKK